MGNTLWPRLRTFRVERCAGSANTRLLILIALVVVLAAVGAYVWKSKPAIREITPSAVMQRLTGQGFVPEFVCTEPAEFVKTIKDRFGTGLGMTETPEGIEILGWAYASPYEGRVVGDKTLIMMARVHGAPVLVFIDKLSEDRSLADPGAQMGNWTGGDITTPMSTKPSQLPDGKLTLFRHTAGDLVLYELTPFERPELLGRMAVR